MTGTCDILDFVKIEIFNLLVLAIVFKTKLFYIIYVVFTTKLADYFFYYIPTYVLTVI
jgi:hypothetical protein